ncbi:putative metalloprotease CJM1_0395 family protein [Andreprevotia chitinilytica]|uniref:putative metalloprotease CJM1_0395 family protein n=1 Tax=Andreprevotia chitinilytica TaxID=396808 RepID=UPI000689472E|nr:putative metalloprotease CJM1_0395 family protein [Andreprevotia chitinilytica]
MVSALPSPGITAQTGQIVAATAATTDAIASKNFDSKKTSGASQQLDAKQQADVDQLKKIDQNVRRHEQAHLAAAGGLSTSGASYQFRTGPDGKQYAVAGEVRIDVSPGNTPDETIKRARVIQAAALAPADPSSQDRAVAARAAQMEAEAYAQLAQQSSQQRKLGQTYGSSSVSTSNFAVQA